MTPNRPCTSEAAAILPRGESDENAPFSTRSEVNARQAGKQVLSSKVGGAPRWSRHHNTQTLKRPNTPKDTHTHSTANEINTHKPTQAYTHDTHKHIHEKGKAAACTHGGCRHSRLDAGGAWRFVSSRALSRPQQILTLSYAINSSTTVNHFLARHLPPLLVQQ